MKLRLCRLKKYRRQPKIVGTCWSVKLALFSYLQSLPIRREIGHKDGNALQPWPVFHKIIDMSREHKSPFLHGMRGADLTQMQRSFVTVLVRQGCNPTQAARIAGYSTPRTAAYDLLRSSSVQAAVAFERSRYVSCELANIATATLKEVMADPAAPASARVAAARTVLEMAGDLGRNLQEAEDDRALSEMSAEDLTKLIERWEGERLALATTSTAQVSSSSRLPH
jgi:hypothetical protein